MIVKVEAWANRNGTSRSEAFRRLVEIGLTVPTGRKPKRGDAGAHAVDAAAAEKAAGKRIDRLLRASDESKDTKAQRKRHLTKIPKDLRRKVG